ncbi:MAG: hypothetical protein JNK14_10360 [Chitinophagaceae bacterium]|nr:hypothetical protein [Chitinophagaceae bacterium]
MKNWQTILTASVFSMVILFCTSTYGQIASTKSNAIAIGFHINQFQNDFGIGLNLTSPYFAKHLAIKLRTSLMWNEFLPSGENETVWASYANSQLGILLRTPVIENKINVYSEGGAAILFPNNKATARGNVIGGYGLFGFEFLPKDKFNYFVEFGGIGTGAQTEKAEIIEVYSNGFLMSVGMRFNF